MPSNNRPWYKRLRPSLEIARRRSSKQDATKNVQPEVRTPHQSCTHSQLCEARDDKIQDLREDKMTRSPNETKEIDQCQPSDALDQNKTSVAFPATKAMASDLIIDDSTEKDGVDDLKPITNDADANTEAMINQDKQKAKDNDVSQENERDGHEDRATEGDDLGSSIEENAVCLADNRDKLYSEIDLNNDTFDTIRTEYNSPLGVAITDDDTETETHSDSSTINEQTSTSWSCLMPCFGFPEGNGNETEESIDDDALSHFVIHNVKKDLGEGKSNRGYKEQDGNNAILSKINDLKKIVHALEMKKSKCTTGGKESEEDTHIAELNSKIEKMVSTLDMQIKAIVSESRQLDLADDEMDSVAMDMALDGFEDIPGTDTEESEDTFHRLMSRVFNCKIGREESTSYTPNSSLISEDSVSVANEDVPFHTRKRFEI